MKWTAFAMLLLAGCDNSSAAPVDSGGVDAGDITNSCARDRIESDLVNPGEAPGLRGPGIDSATGQLRAPGPDGYVISSTYLALRPGDSVMQRFLQLMEPISAELSQQPGLVAIEIGSSPSCGTARTLTVWESEAAMYAFVTGPAHSAAVAAVAEVSRGNSLVHHWRVSSASEVGWAQAAERLGSVDGPYY